MPTRLWNCPRLPGLLMQRVVVRSKSGERIIRAADWFDGYLTTSRRPDELWSKCVSRLHDQARELRSRRSRAATAILPSWVWRHH